MHNTLFKYFEYALSPEGIFVIISILATILSIIIAFSQNKRKNKKTSTTNPDETFIDSSSGDFSENKSIIYKGDHGIIITGVNQSPIIPQIDNCVSILIKDGEELLNRSHFVSDSDIDSWRSKIDSTLATVDNDLRKKIQRVDFSPPRPVDDDIRYEWREYGVRKTLELLKIISK